MVVAAPGVQPPRRPRPGWMPCPHRRDVPIAATAAGVAARLSPEGCVGSWWRRGRPRCGHADTPPREGAGRQGSQPRRGVFGEGARSRAAAVRPERQQPLKATRGGFGGRQRAVACGTQQPRRRAAAPRGAGGCPAGGTGTGSAVGSPGGPSPLRVPRRIFHELHPAPCAEPQPVAGFR